MPLHFVPIPTARVRALQAGAPDSNGQPPERRIADGGAVPCRHCLSPVPAGAAFLVLGHRPFDRLHPYAETGPVFLCANHCAPGATVDRLPPLLTAPHYILRGYDADERIVYGTGRVTPLGEILAYGAEVLSRAEVSFVHVRSATNNCFHLRIETRP